MSELQQLLDRLVAAGAPGAAGWVRNERGSQGAASGLADRRTRQPMRPELRFRAGSLTKSLVAAVVLRLAAEGRLSLADPLERWLPGSLRYGDRVSLRQLLNHTGGVPHRTATLEQALYASRRGRLRAWTPQALVAMGRRPAAGLPGGYGLVVLQHRLRPARPGRGGGQPTDRQLRAVEQSVGFTIIERVSPLRFTRQGESLVQEAQAVSGGLIPGPGLSSEAACRAPGTLG